MKKNTRNFIPLTDTSDVQTGQNGVETAIASIRDSLSAAATFKTDCFEI